MAKVFVEEREKIGTIYTMKNKEGVQLSVVAHGARLYEWLVPVEGENRNLVVGYESLADHQRTRYFGATIGPVAGRIQDAFFEIDGKTFHTEANEKGNTLHSGTKSFDTKEWSATPFQTEVEAGVEFSLESFDGQSGFPGQVKVKVTYALNDDNQFRITYEGTTDAPTILNLTNHGYFNLTGKASEAIDSHSLTVAADFVAQTAADTTTTGEKVKVTGTAFDFTSEKEIGETALDTPFILDSSQEQAMRIVSPDKKVAVTVTTTEPALVLYITGEGEAGQVMKTGTLANRGSIAIETQKIPGTERYPQFGSMLVTPEKPYHAETLYQVTF
ncbi:aldose epimerase family protein [Enterococcus sp. LJL98]